MSRPKDTIISSEEAAAAAACKNCSWGICMRIEYSEGVDNESDRAVAETFEDACPLLHPELYTEQNE